MEDIEDIYSRLERKYERVFAPDKARRAFPLPREEDMEVYRRHIDALLSSGGDINRYKKDNKLNVKNSLLFRAYLTLVGRGCFTGTAKEKEKIVEILQIKKGKSASGVIVVTVFTSPYPEYIDESTGAVVVQRFSCKWDCAYCPNEKDMPRSYLSLEPGCMRAKTANFDCVTQIWDRLNGLYMCGHVCIDKLEVIVLGGTWESYPVKYREQFCRDIYYAANVFWDDKFKRARLTLAEEKALNKTACVKVIGLTLETRPDTICHEELVRLREYGCTRVQLGVQHTDDAVLRAVNRGSCRADTVRAIEMLKDAGFKVDVHMMCNLVGSTAAKDADMFVYELFGAGAPRRWQAGGLEWEDWDVRYPDIQFDQMKIYPMMVTPWTRIEKMYRSGEYVPYSLEELYDVILRAKAVVFPWVRLNRIIRDISGDYLIDHVSQAVGDMRNVLGERLREEGKTCACIRCREVGATREIGSDGSDGAYIVRVRRYNASAGVEHFISAENDDGSILYGFVRLRFPSCKWVSEKTPFECLDGLALIRELHVYGKVSVVGEKRSNVQHRGIGRRLMGVAEKIAREGGWRGMAVISGEGVRGYYERLGFVESADEGWYMIKVF